MYERDFAKNKGSKNEQNNVCGYDDIEAIQIF